MEFAFLSNSKVKYQRTQKGYNTPFAKNGSSYTKNIQFCLALSLYTFFGENSSIIGKFFLLTIKIYKTKRTYKAKSCLHIRADYSI